MNESLWTHLVGVIIGWMKNEEEKSEEKIMFVVSFGWSDYKENEKCGREKLGEISVCGCLVENHQNITSPSWG